MAVIHVRAWSYDYNMTWHVINGCYVLPHVRALTDGNAPTGVSEINHLT